MTVLERIYLDNNENDHYPLKSPSNVYPNGLLSDISILVPSDTEKTCVSSVVCSNGSVSVIFTMYNKTTDGIIKKSYGYCKFMPSRLAVATIYASEDNAPIGWVSYGNIAKSDGMYVSEEEIMDSCTVKNTSTSYMSYVNGQPVPTPTELDIFVSGDLSYDNNKITYSNGFSSVGLDSHNAIIEGGIISVNGSKTTDNDNAIIITLPGMPREYIDESDSSEHDIFTADYNVLNTGNYNVYEITIRPTEYASAKYGENIPPFTCPDSDILLDKISVNGADVKYAETPLDNFIEHYTKCKSR